MSYNECIIALTEIATDIRDKVTDDRYNRMRLAEVYGLMMCSNDIDRAHLSIICDRIDILGKFVGTSLNDISNHFYQSEW